MNSLTLGFIYISGFSWLLCETCVSASNGNWMPLVLFTILFILMFSILGCMRISDRAVETAGPVFSILIGLGILMYAFSSFGESIVGGLLRVVGAAFMIVLGVLAFSYIKGDSESEAH